MIGAVGANRNFNPGIPYADDLYDIDYYPISDRLLSEESAAPKNPLVKSLGELRAMHIRMEK